MKSESKCKVIENHSFLFWKWKSEVTKHEWVYWDKEHRKCKNCERRELYFGLSSSGTAGSYQEDWRNLG